MGSESSRPRLTTRVSGRLVNILCAMLDADEREVVRGDLAECCTAGNQALRDVFGLAVRRQLALWTGRRPWLTLVGLVVPLGLVLSIVSRRAADLSSVYIWMYANNWRWGDLRNAGFWHVLGETAALVLISQLTLVCRSWTSGFVLGSAARGMIQINGVLLSIVLLFGELVGAPTYLAYYRQYLHRSFGLPSIPDLNAPVFALTFYRATLPLIVQAVLVVLPSLWGMRQSAGAAALRPVLRAMLWIAAAATVTSMVIENPDLWRLLKVPARPWILQGWQARLVQIVVFWPIAYLVASVIKRRWHPEVGAS
jgi:hypothetical protein